MKTTIKFLGAVILSAALFIGGCTKKQPASSWSLDNSAVSGQLKKFITAKKTQARALAAQEEKNLPPVFEIFYKSTEAGDWHTATNQYAKLKKMVGNDSSLRGSWWQAVMETYGVFELVPGDEKYAVAFGNDIIKSIPDGSIYFGGTDPGRFLITALSESHADGKPFFSLTQNALADMSYLDYVRSMYDGKIYIPNTEDAQRCFQEYMEDAAQRSQNHQLKPGEDIKIDADGRMQVSGLVSVMNINGLLAKVIFNKNPGQEFYIEESFPLDWMYPQLEPHGLIMKINRQSVPELSEATVGRDHDYWNRYIEPMIGNWLTNDTPIQEIGVFAEKVYLMHNLDGFKGDPVFARNSDAQKMFSKLRSAIGGIYVWRMKHAASESGKDRMAREADLAFRQAWALCPYSPEAVNRYVDLLKSQKRISDAILVAETAAKFPPSEGVDPASFRKLAEELKQAAGTK